MNKSANRRMRRRLFEAAFRAGGLGALIIAGGTLLLLIGGVLALGFSAFTRYEVTLEAALDPATLGVEPGASPAALRTADYRSAVRQALVALFPEEISPAEARALQALVSPGAEFELSRRVAKHPRLLGSTLSMRAPLSDRAELRLKGRSMRNEEVDRLTLTQQQIGWLDALRAQGRIKRSFNVGFLNHGDSSYPELAGVAAGMAGSLMAVGLAILIAAPLGVATAVFLEEFAPKNELTDFLEININNLAAVPSIVFGLLGLTAFVLFFGLPRSAPLVGGLVLALMTLPTVIITTRAALRSLPKSLKEGAQALGASPLDIVLNPLLPAAAPGIITGVIIGFAQALGETAPLLLIGMVAFVATPPARAARCRA